VLGTYQHTLGASTSLTAVQPYITYNLGDGYYLRTSGIMQFNTRTNTSVIPIGIGAGKVIQLPGGYTLNAYAEAQPSVYRAGDGAPNGALRASRGALATEGVHGPDNALGSSAVAKAQANHNDHNPR